MKKSAVREAELRKQVATLTGQLAAAEKQEAALNDRIEKLIGKYFVCFDSI